MRNFNKIISCIIFFIFLAACGKPSYPPATTALEGGREFIDGCLKGDFRKAGFYMIDDAENQNDLLKIKRDYDSKSADEKQKYGSASIIINSDETLNDTMHIINYSNSYDKTARKVKVINRNGAWLVDFKYTFNGNL